MIDDSLYWRRFPIHTQDFLMDWIRRRPCSTGESKLGDWSGADGRKEECSLTGSVTADVRGFGLSGGALQKT